MKKILIAFALILLCSGVANAATVTVTNLPEFHDAMVSTDVTEIEITGSITLTAASSDYDIGRNLTITGGTLVAVDSPGRQIFDMTSGSLTLDGVTLDSSAATTEPAVIVGGGTFEMAGTGTTKAKLTNYAFIRVSDGTANFNGTEFSGNTATTTVDIDGGTVNFRTGSKFENGTGRAVTIRNASARVTFDNTSFVSKAGGAVAISDGTATFNNGGTFQTNGAGIVAGDGGGVLKVTGGTVNLNGTGYMFDGNGSNTGDGGALYFSGGTISFNAPLFTFTNNRANNGGAIYTTQGIPDTAKMVFTKNQAVADGGAIYSAGTLTVGGGTFGGSTTNANKAVNGGAIYATDTVSVSGGAFSFNEANDSGGAVYSMGGVTVTGGTFNENKANGPTPTVDGGGAIYAGGNVNVSGGAFTKNAARISGGAIYSMATVTVTGGTFSENTANGTTPYAAGAGDGGGAIRGAAVTVTGPAAAGIAFTQNVSLRNGGAIFSTGAAAMTNVMFDRNKAFLGGGLYAAGTASVQNSVFEGNEASESGGGLHVDDTATVANCSFERNTASNAAGAIFLPTTSGATANVLNSFFRDNAAKTGGAMHQTGNTQIVNVVRSYFLRNKATGGNGGAIELSSSRLDVSQSTFDQNEATGGAPTSMGGAVYCNAVSYGIVNCTFVGNRTENGYGGGLYIGPSVSLSAPRQSAVFYCTFTRNRVGTGLGGGIYTASSAQIEANILVGNEAGTGDDTFRYRAPFVSGGYNVVGAHGADSGSGPTDNVNWGTDSGVTGAKTLDKFSSLYDYALLFGTYQLDANGTEAPPHMTGSSLDPTLQSAVTTLKLRDSTATMQNPARGILPGTSGAMDFTKYFSHNPAGIWYEHVDARDVRRNANTLNPPSGGFTCDAGAYQTIDRGGGVNPPGGVAVDRVRISGLPNFTLRVGQTCTLSAVVWMSGGLPDYTQAVSWQTSDPNIAYVDRYGNLTLLRTGTCEIIVTTWGLTLSGTRAVDRVTVNVNFSGSSTNIAAVLQMIKLNEALGGGMLVNFASEVDPIISTSSFRASFQQHYRDTPKQVFINEFDYEMLENYESALVARSASTEGESDPVYHSNVISRTALTALEPAAWFLMNNLDPDRGGVVAMKFTYKLEWEDVSDILGRTVTRASRSDVIALFRSLRMVFVDELGKSAIVVDDGSAGVSIESALDSKALVVPGVNTDEYDPNEGELVMYLTVLIGDTEARGGKTVALIDDRIVVVDNVTSGLIDCEMMWLLQASDGGGGNNGNNGGGEGGGGGGCSAAGFAPVLLAIAALAVARRRKA